MQMTTKPTLPAIFEDAKPRIEEALKRYSHKSFSDARQELQEAITYSLFAKSKRVRPMLSLMSYSLFNPDTTPILPAACALECIHTYSLIHDDLPAMDNDDFRRGKPTSHKQYGEDMAILAGDELQTLAFEIMTTHLSETFSSDGILKATRTLAQASGLNGMVGGQVLDIKGHHASQDPDLLKLIHHNKTGALITAALTIPAQLVNAPESTQAALQDLGQTLGLLFQVVDDILDVTGTIESLGKSPDKDTEQEKLTYISVFGLEESKAKANALCTHALNCISSLETAHPEVREALSQFARYLLHRSN